MATVDDLQRAARAVRSARGSFPYARLRVTPAVHQELAEYVAEGTSLDPLGLMVQSFRGVRVEVDADVPDPGWQLDTWRGP